MNLKKIILIVNILLAILIAGTIYLGFRTWQSAGKAPAVPMEARAAAKPTVENNPSASPPKTLEHFKPVIDSDPFMTKKPETSGTIDPILPSFNLNEYELKGTIVGENADSFAIILHRATREQKLYYLKDRLQSATIAQIKADQVVLDIGGNRMENLFMMLVSNSSIGPGIATPQSPGSRSPVMPPLPQVMPPGGDRSGNPPVIKNLRPKPIELKKRPLS